MALQKRVLNSQSLPTLKVHPKSVFVLEYSGGRCGEFLGWWLGQHPGCVPTDILCIGNNRWVTSANYTYEFDNSGTQNLLFLTAHVNIYGPTRTKVDIEIADIDQRIFLKSQGKYVRFYYMLFWIKTGLFAFHWDRLPSYFFDDPNELQQCRDFFKKPWITWKEIEFWKNTGGTLDLSKELKNNWDMHVCDITNQNFFTKSIDIDCLFFQDPNKEYLNICALTSLEPCINMLSTLEKYHQQNIALVENYVGLDIEEFLELDNDTAYALMHAGLQRRWQENFDYNLV